METLQVSKLLDRILTKVTFLIGISVTNEF